MIRCRITSQSYDERNRMLGSVSLYVGIFQCRKQLLFNEWLVAGRRPMVGSLVVIIFLRYVNVKFILLYQMFSSSAIQRQRLVQNNGMNNNSTFWFLPPPKALTPFVSNHYRCNDWCDFFYTFTHSVTEDTTCAFTANKRARWIFLSCLLERDAHLLAWLLRNKIVNLLMKFHVETCVSLILSLTPHQFHVPIRSELPSSSRMARQRNCTKFDCLFHSFLSSHLNKRLVLGRLKSFISIPHRLLPSKVF